MKKTILISGIKGFLGSHLANALKPGYTLYGIGKENGNHKDITVFSSNGLANVPIDPDFIVMCHAAVSSGQTEQPVELLMEVNAGLTEKLVKRFPGSKIIYISSASVYGPVDGTISENSASDPKTPYAISKHEGEQVALRSGNAAIIRLSSLYGNGMKEHTIIPNYVNQALQKKKIEVWGNGHRKQNYIAVEDVCNCIIKVIENFESLRSKVLLGVSKSEYSNSDLAQLIASETNAEIVFVNTDNSISVQYDNKLTCGLLDWQPKTSFNQGIINYIRWKKEPF